MEAVPDPIESLANEVPSETDLPRIRSLRVGCQAKIDAVNEQIQALLGQRKLLEKKLEKYNLLLSPIKRVPGDVLSTIFELATDIGANKWRQHLPTVLPSTICRSWRTMAIQSPKLWSTIPIAPPEHPYLSIRYKDSPHLLGDAERRWEKNMALLHEVLQLWVERSKDCPLFINIGFNTINQAARNGWGGQDPPAKVLPLYMGLIHLACSVARRWKSVELDILTSPSYSVIVGDLLALRPEDVPQLAAISLQTSEKYEHRSITPLGLLGAGSLRSASLMHLDHPWTQLPVQWGTLKELCFGVKVKWMDMGQQARSDIHQALGPRGFLKLLAMCPGLKGCELAVRSVDDDDRDWQTPTSNPLWKEGDRVQLPHLRSLILHGLEPVEMVVSSLDLPSLQQLRFLSSFVGEMPETERQILGQRLLHSAKCYGSQLTDIRFNLLLLEQEGSVAQALENLPHLLGLHLDCSVPSQRLGDAVVVRTRFQAVSTTLLRLLTPDRGEEGDAATCPLCPKLERFACTLLMLGFTEGQLVDFIDGRRQRGRMSLVAKIKEVDVAFGTLQQVDIRSELEKRDVDMDNLTLRFQYARSW